MKILHIKRIAVIKPAGRLVSDFEAQPREAKPFTGPFARNRRDKSGRPSEPQIWIAFWNLSLLFLSAVGSEIYFEEEPIMLHLIWYIIVGLIVGVAAEFGIFNDLAGAGAAVIHKTFAQTTAELLRRRQGQMLTGRRGANQAPGFQASAGTLPVAYILR